MKPHKNLVAWQTGMDLVVSVYAITREFPREETYGLTSQLRRAAVSVPSNIAEGACDRTTEQFRNFLSIAIGSLNEINTQVEVALRVGYIDQEKYTEVQAFVDKCLAVTYGLHRSIMKAQ